MLALHMKYSYRWILLFRPTSGHNLSGEEMHFHKHDQGKIQTSQKAASHFVLLFVVVMYNFFFILIVQTWFRQIKLTGAA